MCRPFKPRKMLTNHKSIQSLNRLIRLYMDYIPQGWSIVMVDQVDSKCHIDDKWITISLHHYNEGCSSFHSTVCHEIAHIENAMNWMIFEEWYKPHGVEFIKRFKEICPERLWKYEPYLD